MNIRKVVNIIIISILLVAIINTNVKAAGAFNASISTDTVTVGDTISITVSATGAAGTYAVSANSSIISITSGSSTDFLDNSSSTITYKAEKEGTVTITAKAVDMTDNDDDKISVSGSKTFTVTVKAKQGETTPTEPITPEEKKEETPPTTNPTPAKTETPKAETPKAEEPNFSSADKTMYSTASINLRSSWSTSSAAIGIKKGTELKVTATSTNKVNGYVWYRVIYNGQTKYVASNLLTSTKPVEKSNNANLKALTIEKQSLVPEFSKQTTSYKMQVANEIEKLEIKAEPEDSKSTVSIKGNEKLNEGENTVIVSVSAEDGTTKIYEIKVERLKKEEKAALGLKSLSIEDTNIATKFKPETYNYEVDLKEDLKKLNIEAVANNEKAAVEILGNEELKEGENVITIIVSLQDSEEKATYQVKVKKETQNAVPTNNVIAKTTKEEINPKIFLFGGIAAFVILALIIVVIYTIKHRKQENEDYIEDYEENDDEIDELPDELPEKQIEQSQIQQDVEIKPRKKGKHF